MSRYLIQGHESSERLAILFDLAGRFGDNTKDALLDHLNKGHTEELSASMNGLTKPNFSRALKRINEVAGLVEQVKELDWGKANHSKNN